MRLLQLWRRRLAAITAYSQLESLELLLGASLVVRGSIWLFSSAPVTLSVRPVWIIMASVLSDHSWGILFVSLGLLQIISVLHNYFLVRKLCALASFVSWAFASFVFFSAEPPLPNDGMLPIMAAVALFVFISFPFRPPR